MKLIVPQTKHSDRKHLNIYFSPYNDAEVHQQCDKTSFNLLQLYMSHYNNFAPLSSKCE